MLEKERLQNNYDFLRIFASVCVMFFHSFALIRKMPEEPFTMLSNGKISTALIGLSIFFSISGYLIAGSVIRSSSLVSYLWKRLLRIQPLLLFLCIITIFLIGPIYSTLNVSDYFSNSRTWTYMRNVMPLFGMQFSLPGVFTNNPGSISVNGSLWTLVVEERLYLIMCLLFILKFRKKAFILIILIFNTLFLVHNLPIFDLSMPIFDRLDIFYDMIFLNSALLYVLKVNFNSRLYYYLASGIIIFSLGAIFSLTGILACYSMPLIVNSIAHIKGFLNKAGKWGDFTYGTYVFAFPVQQMLIESYNFTQPYYLFLVTLLITFPLAILSWYFLEKKFLKLKNRVQ